MAKCEQCGNDYDKSFQNCAIQKLAPSACIAMSASSGMVSNFNDAVISFGLSFSNTCGSSSSASLHPAGPVSFDVSKIIVI